MTHRRNDGKASRGKPWVMPKKLTCVGADGKIKWEDELPHNALADEGEQDILGAYFKAVTAPATTYLGLCNDTLAETDTLALIAEEGGTGIDTFGPSGGYSRLPIQKDSEWSSITQSNSGYATTCDTKEWTATATIGPVNTMFLATTANNTGLLLAYVDLSTSRTLVSGDKLYATMTAKMC